MVNKRLLIFLFIFFLFSSSIAFTRTDRTLDRLKQEYGQNLNTDVPFFVRYAFAKHHGIDWSETTFDQRKDFLTDYEAKMAQQEAQQRAEARAEALKEKQIARQKRDLQRQIALEERAERQEQKATDKYYADRLKNFQRMVQDQQKELAGLETSAQLAKQMQQLQAQQSQQSQQNGP